MSEETKLNNKKRKQLDDNIVLARDMVSDIAAGRYKNIVVLSGAGISTSAGIPDYRSKNGLYNTLRAKLLTTGRRWGMTLKHNKSFIFSKSLFVQDQLPLLEYKRDFILGVADGKWKPTPTHKFLKWIEDKGCLKRVYTQNIDGLEYDVGIDPEKIISCHGTMKRFNCEYCGEKFDIDDYKEKVRDNIKQISEENIHRRSKEVECSKCGKPGIKPDIILFGSSLPEEFFKQIDNDFDTDIDLLLVLGTSLSVSPVNQLVKLVKCPCVVVNRDPLRKGINGLDFEGKDIFIQGECDELLHTNKELILHENETRPKVQIKSRTNN